MAPNLLRDGPKPAGCASVGAVTDFHLLGECMMRRLVMGLLAIAFVSLSASPLTACHHRRRGCEGGCGCTSSCGSASSCSGGCNSGCTAANSTGVSTSFTAAAGAVYPAQVASVGRWQPTPPPEPPTNPRANLASAQSRTEDVGK
jgi:hypothetical protein